METMKSDPVKLAEMDYQFHIAVVKAAHNDFLNSLLKTVFVLLSTKNKESLGVDKFIEMLPIHSEIYKAIENANPAAAEAKMRQHMNLLRKAYQLQDIS
ncbi:MAG TPA: FCD domain-containing protein, partial [Bacillota bacterium]